MAIPYVLAVHAAYVARTISMLRNDGFDDAQATWTHRHRADVDEIPLAVVHEYFEERASGTLQVDLLQLFHLCRRVRNRIIHFAGRAGSRLPADYRDLPGTVRDSWERLTGRPLTVTAEGQLDLAEGELIAVLAISRHLADDVNHILANTLPSSSWARIAVRDYADLEPRRFAARDQRLRRVRGYVRMRYAPIGLADTDLVQAIADHESA